MRGKECWARWILLRKNHFVAKPAALQLEMIFADADAEYE